MNWDTSFSRHEQQVEHTMPCLPDGSPLPVTISARDLQLQNFPPISWVVPDILPEGLTILAGKPKLGKSWLAMQIGDGVANGGEVLGRPVEQGAVLYAALEDNARRLKSRMQKTSNELVLWSDSLEFATEWPRLDASGIEAFQTWADHNSNARLIIIDTLATVRPTGGGNEPLHQRDYGAMRPLHALANDRGIAVLVVHHLRKAEADDPFDTVSGSTGLTGAADATLILKTSADGPVLYGRGRDMPEFESAVEFDLTTCRWADLGRPSDAHGSATRKAVRQALKDGKITPKDISEVTGIEYDLCAKTLQRMAEGGEVQKGGRGRYRLRPDNG